MLLLRAAGWLLGLIGFFLLLVSGLSFAVLDDPPLALKVIGGSGALLMGLWLFLDWGSLQNLGKDQTVGRGLVSSFAGLIAVGIVVAANYVANQYDKRWDITETKRYTLSDQSIELVKKLDQKVQVIAFFRAGQDAPFRELMERYKEHSTLLEVEYYDPYANPAMAEQNQIMSEYGTVILKVGENSQRLESDFGEEAFTNALVRASSSEQHSVCFVTGHGERDLEDMQTVRGLGVVKAKLEGVNYKTSVVTLLDTQPTPETCRVVVLASPQVDLLPGERDRLAQYVAAGGNLLALLDAPVDPTVGSATAADFARYGLRVGNDVVMEGDPYRSTEAGKWYVLLDDASYDIHPVTSKLKGVAILALARSVGKGDDVAGLNVQVFAHASEQSWGETALTDSPDSWAPDANVDLIGKVPLAAAVEVTDPANLRTVTAATEGLVPSLPVVPGAPADPAAPADPVATPAPVVPAAAELPKKAGGKVIVWGDGDFASNQLVTAVVNQDLFLNGIAWMVGETEQIAIRPNEAGKGKLTLDGISLFVSAVIALVATPGIAIIGAVGMWIRRRRM